MQKQSLKKTYCIHYPCAIGRTLTNFYHLRVIKLKFNQIMPSGHKSDFFGKKIIQH